MLATRIKKKKAQSSLEYVAILVIVMAALLVVGVYFKRGMQGRWRTSSDELADQYDPYLAHTDLVYILKEEVDTTIYNKDDEIMEGVWTYRHDNSVREEGMDGHIELPFY